MHMRRALPIFALLSLFAVPQADAQFRPEAPAVGEDFHVELGMNFWQPTPSIVIGSDSLRPVSTSGLDFVQEFGIEDTRFREFRAVLHGGKSKLRISHVDMKYNEAATLRHAIIVGGRPIDVAAAATADLEWDLWRIGYEHDFVKNPRGLLGFVAEMNFSHVVADLNATSQGFTARSLTDEKVPFPALGVVARVYPHKNIGVGGEWTGFKMPGFIADRLTDSNNGDAHLRNWDVYVIGSITRYFGIQGGYRALKADYTLDDKTGDLQMKGPYLGAMVRF
jgi:hypothetical protein